MAKLSILGGSTSVSVNLFIQDSSSTTGAGLTGLVFNTSSLVAYYALPRAAAVAITLATLAAVTSSYSSGGFKEIDATNMPGWYRLDIPNAALVGSNRFVSLHLKGATNMAPLPLEIELTGWDNQNATSGGMSNLDTTVSSRLAPAGTLATVTTVTNRVTANSDQLAGQTVTAASGVTFPTSVASTTNITAGTITTVTNLTNAPTSGDFTATMKTSLNAATPSVTVSDKTGFSLSAAGIQAIWDALTAALTTVGSIGRLLVTDIDATISSRSTFAGGAVASVTGNVGGNVTGSVGSVIADVGITQGAADKVWLSAARTLTSFGTLVSDVTTAVWAAGSRTLTSYGTLVTDIWANGTRTLTSFGSLVADTAAAVWAAASRTLTAFGFTVTTDVSALVTTNLDVAVSTRLASSSYTTPPTTSQNADALLARSIGGGSNGGHTVQDALRPLRNKVTTSGGTLTVYSEDDTTIAWTGALTTDAAAEPIVSQEPS